MPAWDDYTLKNKPEDGDTLMIKDNSATNKANKRTKFSGLWDWIVDKLAAAVISNLTTSNKTVIGALNELNSNTSGMTYVNAGQFSSSVYGTIHKAAQHIVDNVLPNKELEFFFVSFTFGTQHLMIAQKYRYSNEYGAYIVFGYGESSILYGNKVSGSWNTYL